MCRTPSDDGLFALDLESGEYRLLCSYEQLFEMNPVEEARNATMWFNHPTVNTDNSRVTWVVRYLTEDGAVDCQVSFPGGRPERRRVEISYPVRQCVSPRLARS